MTKIEYNEDDLPGMRVEPYDAKHVKQLERQLAKKQCELDQMKSRCKEADSRAKPYGMTEWKGGEEARASYIERITALEKENAMLVETYNAACAQNEKLEQANEYIEKLCAGQDRKIRETELKHQAEINKLRAALGMFLVANVEIGSAMDTARKALGVKDE